MKSFKTTLLGLLLFALVVPLSHTNAADFRFDEESGNVVVSADETLKNLYTAGNVVSINSKIEEDLYAAGNMINITEGVEDDVLVLGNSITIDGDIGGTVHSAGGTIIVNGEIEDDLFLAGGNVSLSESARIGGDLFIAGGIVTINGNVEGEVKIAADNINLNGKTADNVVIEAGKLTIGKLANIEKDLHLTAPKEANIKEGATIAGEIKYTKKTHGHHSGKFWLYKAFTVFFLVLLLMGIATALVFLYLFKEKMLTVVKHSTKDVWKNLGLGFAVLFLTPILALLLAITVIGLQLSLILLVAYFILLLITKVVASLIVGSWIFKRIRKSESYQLGWKEVVVGVLVFALISLIPFIGWIFGFIITLIVLGAIIDLLYTGHIARKQDNQ